MFYDDKIRGRYNLCVRRYIVITGQHRLQFTKISVRATSVTMAHSGDRPVYSIRLKRSNADTTWGFRLAGGQDYNAPITIQSVTKGSLAEQSGLKPGDMLLRVGTIEVLRYEHQQATMEIKRGGNDLQLTVRRSGGVIASEAFRDKNSDMANSPSLPTGQPSLIHHQPNHPSVDNKLNRTPQSFPDCSAPADIIAQTQDGRTKRIFHGQYNSPMGLYTDKGIQDSYKMSLARIGNDKESGSPSASSATPSSSSAQRPQSNMHCGACGGKHSKLLYVKIRPLVNTQFMYLGKVNAVTLVSVIHEIDVCRSHFYLL